MKNIKKQLEDLYWQLGRARYRMASMFDPPGGKEEIAHLEKQINVLEDKMKMRLKRDQ